MRRLRTIPLPQNAAAIVAIFCIALALRFGISNEIPTGAVAGHVTMAENDQPLGQAEIILSPKDGSEEGLHTRYAHSNGAGAFTLSHVPAGDYTISASTDAHAADRTLVTVSEGQMTPIDIPMKRSQPELELKVHQRVFGTKEKARLAISGYESARKSHDTDGVAVAIYRTRLSSVLPDPDAAEALGTVGREWQPATSLPDALMHPTHGQRPVRFEARDFGITNANREGFYYQRLDLGALGTGLYLLNISHGKDTACAWLLVTDTALVVKKAGRQIVAYAADMVSGQPLANSTVRAYKDGAVIATTQTDSRGVAEIKLAPRPASARDDADHESSDNGGNSSNGGDASRVTTVVIRGDDEAVVTKDAYNNEEAGAYAVHSYTDRPIYRPGQRIYFKGVVRKVRDEEEAPLQASEPPGARYSIPANEPVRVQIRDTAGERLLNQTIRTDRHGAYSGMLDLLPDAPTGTYSMISSVGGEEHTHEITIASYQKPEFSVTVKPDKPRYVRGDTVKMTVTAKYYFGSPVAGAKVNYSVYASPDYGYDIDDSDPDAYPEDANTEDHVMADSESSFYGEAAADGTATLDADGRAEITFVAKSSSDPLPAQSDTYTASITVVEGEDREVTEEGTATVVSGDFKMSVAPDGYVAAPNAPTNVVVTAQNYDGHPMAMLPFELEMSYHEWKRNGDGQYEYKTTPAGLLKLMTGADGKLSVPVVPRRTGELYIKARAYDSHGRKIVAETDLWVSSDQGGDLDTEYSDLSLLTDKKQYNPGDTARVMINTSRTGQTVLLTIEGDRVYATQTVEITKRTSVVRVNVLANWGPNVFLSACYVRDKHFASSESPLRVLTREAQVHVKIVADRDALAQAAGITNQSRYHPGDKITYTIQTTDFQGRPISSDLSFGVVDEAIYALKEDDPHALRDAFYPRRTNSVQTDYSFAIAYLGDADKSEPEITARKRFPDTAYWNPSVETDEHGLASVTFALPDNLTTWRATATAVTADTRVGVATQQVIVSREFMVRLETPRFLTQHDHASLATIINNDTGTNQTASVHLQATNLTVVGEAVQTATVEAGKTCEMTWPVNADGYGAAQLRVTAWTPKSASGAQYTDGIESSLAIRPHGREAVTAFAGSVSARNPETEVVRLDPESVPGLSKLTVRITPSLAGSLLGASDYLIGFPYGCTEQTMSRFLPDILVEKILRLHGMSDVKRQAELPRMVRAGLMRLYRFQHADTGGWGWWEHDTDNPWMTAYVLTGLSIAQDEGYTVTRNAVAHGLKSAHIQADAKTTGLDDRVFLIYAMAMIGDKSGAAERLRTVDRTLLHTRSIAYLALTEQKLGQSTAADMDLLRKQAITIDEGTHWNNEQNIDYSKTPWLESYEWLGDDTETTALVVRAMLASRASGDVAIVGRSLGWLMAHRTGEYWTDTRDTSFVLATFSEYLSRQPDYNPGGEVTVQLNGKPIQTVSLTPDLQHEQEVILRVPTTDLRPEKNDVTLLRTNGTSPVFYSVEMKQTIATEDLPAISPPPPAPEPHLTIHERRALNAMPKALPKVLSVKREYLRVKPRQVGEEGWSLQTEPTGDQLAVEDHVRVRLTIEVPRDMSYVLIEDAYPAGLTVNERGEAEETGDWTFQWQGIDVRDDRIAFFMRTLSAGEHTIEYNLRAQTPGVYHAMPTLVQAMYQPELRAESAESHVTVR